MGSACTSNEQATGASRPRRRLSRPDAAVPQLATGSYDAVLCRHVLRAMPDPPLWGRAITDERYLVLSRASAPTTT